MADAADHEKSGQGRGVGFDLDRMTVQELTALRDQVEDKRREKLEVAKEAVLLDTRARLAELGVSLDSLLRPKEGQGRKSRRSGGDGKVPVKYRGPGGQEWSGRGRSPQWVADVEKQGKSREDFLARQ